MKAIYTLEIISTWGTIEPVEGQFNWDDVDYCIDYWHARDKQVRLRISVVSAKGETEDHQGTPSWIFDNYGVGFQDIEVSSEDNEDKFYRFSDSTNSTYREKMENFLNVYADRYKDDDRIEAVDLKTYGKWGEHHSEYKFATIEERKETLKALIDIWYNAWEEKKPLRLPLANEFGYKNTNFESDPVMQKEYEKYSKADRNGKDQIYKGYYAYDYAITKPLEITF
jgi:hypothetical protein